jgi:hypothetical protein
LNNGIVVFVDGHSFADGVSREISVLFGEKTITTSSDRQVRWVGSSGLYHLSPEMKVLISSDENIRGKLKYQAKYVNVLI